MRVNLSVGREVLLAGHEFPPAPTVAEVLDAVKDARPDIHAGWLGPDGRLRESLAVLVNGDHVRYREGLRTRLGEADEVYVIPLVAGG
jgi:molybdopterin converting factor small subunit